MFQMFINYTKAGQLQQNKREQGMSKSQNEEKYAFPGINLQIGIKL